MLTFYLENKRGALRDFRKSDPFSGFIIAEGYFDIKEMHNFMSFFEYEKRKLAFYYIQRCLCSVVSHHLYFHHDPLYVKYNIRINNSYDNYERFMLYSICKENCPCKMIPDQNKGEGEWILSNEKRFQEIFKK